MDFMKMWKQSYLIVVIIAVVTLVISFGYTVLDVSGRFMELMQNVEQGWVSLPKTLKLLWLRFAGAGPAKLGNMLNDIRRVILPD